MGNSNTIPVSLLRELLAYDPQTGFLFWKERNESHFSAGKISAAGKAGQWNSKYAGKRVSEKPSREGYATCGIKPRTFKAHRVTWALHYGKWPDGQIDHINGVRNDNRISNLRDCTQLENCTNRKLSTLNKTGFFGIYFYPPTGKWQAEIKRSGKRTHLGYFNTKEDAILARKEAQEKLGFHHNHGRLS